MKKKTYLLMALTLVSMGMNAQNSGNSSLEKGIGEFTKTMTIGELQGLPRSDTSISIQHLDFALIAKVNLCLIAHLWSHLTRHVDAGSTHLESSALRGTDTQGVGYLRGYAEEKCQRGDDGISAVCMASTGNSSL